MGKNRCRHGECPLMPIVGTYTELRQSGQRAMMEYAKVAGKDEALADVLDDNEVHISQLAYEKRQEINKKMCSKCPYKLLFS